MPNQRIGAAGRHHRSRPEHQGNHAPRRPSNQRPSNIAPSRATPVTCERDDTYGLISVVYHALQGAETCAQYVLDAQRSKNAALEAFFEEARVAQNDLAFKGKHLLAAQLEAALDEDLDDDDAFGVGLLDEDREDET
jgi:hypothetical protein